MSTNQDINPRLLWDRYRNNLPRHLLGISRYLQSDAMQQLTEQRGHSGLKMSFEPYITLVGSGGSRLTELADILGISKQACNQTANQIERAGYIERISDPNDGRAKKLRLTRRGQQLMRDGAAVAESNEDYFRTLVGNREIRQLTAQLAELFKGLGLARPNVSSTEVDSNAYLSGLLPRLSDYVMHRLMHLTIAKGHSGLKMSHGQVLTLIGLSGGSIQKMASIQAVSKQAISAVVNDLEELGYLYRQTDPADARQQLILFTPMGLGLLADSVSSVDELNSEFSEILGEAAFAKLKVVARQLYLKLHLEEDVFGPQQDLQTLAQKLKQQLGQQDIRELTRLLQHDNEVLA